MLTAVVVFALPPLGLAIARIVTPDPGHAARRDLRRGRESWRRCRLILRREAGHYRWLRHAGVGGGCCWSELVEWSRDCRQSAAEASKESSEDLRPGAVRAESHRVTASRSSPPRPARQ